MTKAKNGFRFEGAKTEKLLELLDGVAWLDRPTVQRLAQFAGVDPRTASKLVSNCEVIGLLVRDEDGSFKLSLPYPHKGPLEERRAVVKEAMVRMPLLRSVRQFLRLGDDAGDAARKAAAVHAIDDYNPKDLDRLMKWADEFAALDPAIDVETLVEEAEQRKNDRPADSGPVVFLSHSGADKDFVRRLATDLTAEGVLVWLDEQRILVGDSIVERVTQGLAEADYFVFIATQSSIESKWATRELNSALMAEIGRRRIKVLPILLEACELPAIIGDKKYADFTMSYKEGLQQLLTAIKES